MNETQLIKKKPSKQSAIEKSFLMVTPHSLGSSLPSFVVASSFFSEHQSSLNSLLIVNSSKCFYLLCSSSFLRINIGRMMRLTSIRSLGQHQFEKPIATPVGGFLKRNLKTSTIISHSFGRGYGIIPGTYLFMTV